MQESKRKVIHRRVVREFQELPLYNSYVLKLRVKEFTAQTAEGTKTDPPLLSLDLYQDKIFIKSICLPLSKIPEFIKTMRSVKRQLQIVEPVCGSCCFIHTDSCFYGRAAPIIKTDSAKSCEYFTPKTQKHKLRRKTYWTKRKLTEEEKKEEHRQFKDLVRGKITKTLDNGYYLVK